MSNYRLNKGDTNMFRFFSCLFGQTRKEKEQSELIKKQNTHIKKQSENIEQLKNNQSNNNISYSKTKNLEITVKELEDKIKEFGEIEEEIYFSEMKKLALRDFEQSVFKGKGEKTSGQNKKPLTDAEAIEKIKKIKERYKNDQ